MKTSRRWFVVLAVLALLGAACSDSDDSGDVGDGDPAAGTDGDADNADSADDPSGDDPPGDDPPGDDPPGDDPPGDDPPADDPPESGEPALVFNGNVATINWDAVTPTFIAGAGSADDPFFHIHSSNDADGFYLSFEMYTIYGEAWTGQTGTFDIDCGDPVTSTGICAHFLPVSADGNDLGADFGAIGQVTINSLGAGGYDIDVSGLTFTDGTTIADFSMVG